MTLNEFLTHFGSVKSNGIYQYTACCPAHDDKHPSLSIGLSKDKSRILIHCHAGCTTKNILNAINLTEGDLYMNNSKNKKNSPVLQEAKYKYRDKMGTVVYTKTRRDYTDGSKSFFFEQPNGTKSVNDVQREIYNLPAVLSATKIYFVEGEKCADAVIRHGAVATTLDSGAKSHWYPHFNEYLKGKEVIIIPDNDTPGMDYAKRILQNIPNARLVMLPGLSEKGDIYDWLNMGHTVAEVDELPTYEFNDDTSTLIEQSENTKTNKFDKDTQAETIIRLVEENETDLFHDKLHDAYAAVMIHGHREVWAIESENFITWLNSLYYSAMKKPAKSYSIVQAKEVLKAKAIFGNEKSVSLYTRVAKYDSDFWYSLSNDDWEAVKITANGWEIIDKPPTIFRKFRHQNSQVKPMRGGEIRRILKYINLHKNHTMFLCWLVCCFVPDIPHAMPIFFGEKGAAKTTACALLKRLIDPSALETLTITKNSKSLIVNLHQHWFLPFDNISRIDEETSDTLCRAITGGGIQQRKLFTDADDCIFTFQKCIALNGINNVANKPDLLDRAILIELSRIEEKDRLELSQLKAEFEVDLPYILGGIFDVLSKAIKIYSTVKIDKLPRMADFARWGYAVGEALGGHGNEFLNEYKANQEIRNVEILNTDIVATLIVAFMKDRKDWSGLVSALHVQLIKLAEQHGISSKEKEFPAQPNILSRRLNNLKSNLAEAGIFFNMNSTTQGRKIFLTNEKKSQLPPYPHSLLSSDNAKISEDDDSDTGEIVF